MDKETRDPFDILENEINKEMESIYSKKTISYAKNPINVGRMTDPDGAAYIKGLCGDSIEIYLIIKDNIITEITFFSDGCGVTYACGSAVTELSKGKDINFVLGISPKTIIDYLEGLPDEHIHCSILAVSALHKAIADYLLQRY